MEKFFNNESMAVYLEEVFPQVNGKIEILQLSNDRALVKLKTSEFDLRPGGTVSGPSMFFLADVTFYIAVLASIGEQPLAVTTNCSINFMRKPDPFDLIAEAQILKRGSKLVVGDVRIKSGGGNELVAQASFTYSLPPQAQAKTSN